MNIPPAPRSRGRPNFIILNNTAVAALARRSILLATSIMPVLASRRTGLGGDQAWRTALVVGVSGIIGGNAARELLGRRLDRLWPVAQPDRRRGRACCRSPPTCSTPASVKAALADVAPTHVFFATWSRRATEAENIEVNGAMVRNVLDALSPKQVGARTSALVTGLKHYLGPFDAYVSGGSLPETPLREEQPRLDLPNFYYAQEDEVYRRGRARRLHLERPSPAHGHRQGHRQCDEHGHRRSPSMPRSARRPAGRSGGPVRRRSGTASPT